VVQPASFNPLRKPEAPVKGGEILPALALRACVLSAGAQFSPPAPGALLRAEGWVCEKRGYRRRRIYGTRFAVEYLQCVNDSPEQRPLGGGQAMTPWLKLLLIVALGLVGGYLVWLAGSWIDSQLHPKCELIRFAGVTLFGTFVIVFGLLELVWPVSDQRDSF